MKYIKTYESKFQAKITFKNNGNKYAILDVILGIYIIRILQQFEDGRIRYEKIDRYDNDLNPLEIKFNTIQETKIGTKNILYQSTSLKKTREMLPSIINAKKYNL